VGQRRGNPGHPAKKGWGKRDAGGFKKGKGCFKLLPGADCQESEFPCGGICGSSKGGRKEAAGGG